MVLIREIVQGFRASIDLIGITAFVVVVRWLLWEAGLEGMTPTALSTGALVGVLFIMGLVVAGSLADYKDAESTPTELATSLHAMLRDGEYIHRLWGVPDMTTLRERLIAVVTTLRADLQAGDSRTCQAAVEELSQSIRELEGTDVPEGHVSRLRDGQTALRSTVIRIYRLQRELFLPSAHAMIVVMVALIVLLLMVTNFDGLPESLVAVGFLVYFFLALLRLLATISTPFAVGVARTDDDVSLFLLTEFVVQAVASATGDTVVEDVELRVEEVEERLVDVEETTAESDATTTAEVAKAAVTDDKPTG